MESRQKILLMDDDPALLETYRELLAQLPTHPEIVTANSGSRGLELLKDGSFRLLICDLKMPRMDGLQVLTIVRRRFPELRTVVLTGVADEQFRTRAYGLGVDLFWLKPDTQQNMTLFLQCVESLLNSSPQGGFRGIQSKSLMDILQMECLAQSSTVLRITRAALVGHLWILNGELVDAETEGARGEAAFRRILEWKSGTFENLPADPDHERTIHKSINALLLETAQAIDETHPAAPGEAAEETDLPEHRRTVWRLAALTREGADFVISLCPETPTRAESCGIEATPEQEQWMRMALSACLSLSQLLECGPLEYIGARNHNNQLVLLPSQTQAYLVGWPLDTPPAPLPEKAKQLIASWES